MQDRTVDLVEADGIIDMAVCAYRGVVAHSAEQPIRHPRCTSTSRSDRLGSSIADVDVEDCSRPVDDRRQVGPVVVVDPRDVPEPIAQRWGDPSDAGCRTDERCLLYT